MGRSLLIAAYLFCFFMVSGCGLERGEGNEFAGIIESRPEGKVGTWVVGGLSIEVTESTRIKEEHGPLTVGACAEVELKGERVDEMESETMRECKK